MNQFKNDFSKSSELVMIKLVSSYFFLIFLSSFGALSPSYNTMKTLSFSLDFCINAHSQNWIISFNTLS